MAYDFYYMLDKINEDVSMIRHQDIQLPINWYTDIYRLSMYDSHARATDSNKLKGIVSKTYTKYMRCSTLAKVEISKPIMDLFNNITTSSVNLYDYPKMTAHIDLHFTLARPYLSKDDALFHVNENPIRKDKVFKIPMVNPGSWKGNLRWTASKIFVDGLPQRIDESNAKSVVRDRRRLVRLFGQEKDSLSTYLDEIIRERLPLDQDPATMRCVGWFHELFPTSNSANEDEFKQRGCLVFFPTFFEAMALEVFNPHSRKTRAGTKPVLMECVPSGTEGRFQLLYLPFSFSQGNHWDEVFADLIFLCGALKEMFLTYGFSAKKSLDYGVAKNNISGQFVMAGLNKDSTAPKKAPRGEKVDLKSLGGAMKQKQAEAGGGGAFSSFVGLVELIDRYRKEVK